MKTETPELIDTLEMERETAYPVVPAETTLPSIEAVEQSAKEATEARPGSIARLLQFARDLSEKHGRLFNLLIQLLIVFSMISFTIETLPNLSPGLTRFLLYTEWVVVIIFSLEYLFRLIVSKRRLAYVFSFYGLIDLLAILPFYLHIVGDLRSIRAVRLLRMVRMLRVLKLVRYTKAAYTLRRAFTIARDEIVLYIFATVILLYLAAVGIYFFEHTAQPENFSSVFHSLWWAICTITTVGYGDVVPVTIGGRVFTFCVLILGLGIVAVPAGLIASAHSQARDEGPPSEEQATPDSAF